MAAMPVTSSTRGTGYFSANGLAVGPTGCQPPLDIGTSPCPDHGRYVLPFRPACASCTAAGYAPLAVNETDDPLKRWDVIVAPDAKVVRGDSTVRRDRGGLGEHETGAAHGAAAEMDQMPIVGEAVRA